MYVDRGVGLRNWSGPVGTGSTTVKDDSREMTVREGLLTGSRVPIVTV